jgi:hypothetical protein
LEALTNKQFLFFLGFLGLSVIAHVVYKKNNQRVFFVLLYDILILELNIFNINRPRYFLLIDLVYNKNVNQDAGSIKLILSKS